MEEGRKDKILMVTAKAPTNIAVIKYWGKRDEKLILPVNSSISITLNTDDLCATTTVAASFRFSSDRMWLNGKEFSLEGERYKNCFRELKSRAEDVVDENTGVLIKKEDWMNIHFHIASENNFPTAAGLASSAAGFACLVFALAELMGVKEKYEGELSAIARVGSGSACRSLYGGFVKWNMGKEKDGRDSIAVQLAEESHWADLVIVIAVVSSKQKETSSTAGMQESVHSSTLLDYRAKVVVPSRILEMEAAIRACDFSSFAQVTCADSNQFHAICLDTVPPIFYMNDISHRIINLVERWNKAEGTPQVAYTFDAGPNAVLFAPNMSIAGLLLHRLLFYFPPDHDTELSRYVVGDQEIIRAACLGLPRNKAPDFSPPEVTDMPIRVPGQLKYIICTRPGHGPLVLRESDCSLLNPTTGLPLIAQ
eukprot:c20695_g1_i1 orf=345-1616(-)